VYARTLGCGVGAVSTAVGSGLRCVGDGVTYAGAKTGGWLDSPVGCPVYAYTFAYRIDAIVVVASSRHNILSALACLSPGELIRAMKEGPSPQSVLDHARSLS
jgi:hypothetical protein